MASLHSPSPRKLPRALLFDVIGTVANWRLTLPRGLSAAATAAVSAGTASLSASSVVSHMMYTHWEAFAVEWVALYIDFSFGFMPGVSDWVDNYQVRLRTLRLLVDRKRLTGLWSESELNEVTRLWHRLEAWPDSARGIAALNTLGSLTSTLSNGSADMLKECMAAGNILMTLTLGSDDFKAYKPSPLVYLGAVEKMSEESERRGLGKIERGEVAMVAAHLHDLEAAKAQGLVTIYVERPLEETKSKDEVKKIKARMDYVDVWIEDGDGGFEEIARRFT